jgi:hypothetical protein
MPGKREYHTEDTIADFITIKNFYRISRRCKFLIFFALEKSSFPVMIAPFAPTLPPIGAEAHYDVPV